LYAAAADAARHWYFPDNRWKDKTHRFEAEITFHGPITGKVIAKDGTPVAGVVVSGILSCPPKQDRMTTGSGGSFRIEHPGTVLHFDPPDTFQPQALVIPPDTSALNITLDTASNTLPLAVCGKPQPGFERFGEGKYGLQFDVPPHDVKLILGEPDVDYVVHFVKANKSNDRIEFWFGPYAINLMPDRGGLGNSDRGISGRAVLSQPKMAGVRRADEQTSTQEPHSSVQGEGGLPPQRASSSGTPVWQRSRVKRH
jgi:hypothetical protein